MSIHEDIVRVANEVASGYKQNFCNDVCSPVSVVKKGTTDAFVKLRCDSCRNMVNYVTDELVMLIDNTNWDYIYGPKNMSMMQAISYIQQERQQFISSAKSIAEYASDECEKEWGITGRFNTAMGESERRNPLITGINEFFEEENIARREHMTANVAEPQKLMREANRCKRGAGILVTRMLAMIRRKYPRFDFSFYY